MLTRLDTEKTNMKKGGIKRTDFLEALPTRDKAFVIVPIGGMVFFAAVFVLAILSLPDIERHKRLMLLAAISILDAAVARWFLTFLAPPGPPGPPPVAVTIAPALVAYLLIVAAMVYDWRTRSTSSAVVCSSPGNSCRCR